MVTIEVKKELIAKIRLPEMEVETRVIIMPDGEVEMQVMPWSEWKLSNESFEELVEDYNLLKAQIKLCVENLAKEQLTEMSRTGE